MTDALPVHPRTNSDKQRELAEFRRQQHRDFMAKCLALYPDNPIGPGITGELLVTALYTILDLCADGERPHAREVLRSLAPERPHLERWVKREASAKIMDKLFQAWPSLLNHPLLQEMSRHGYLGEERKRAMCSSSIANFGAQAYASTRELGERRQLQTRVAELETAVAQHTVGAILTEAAKLHWHTLADEMLARKAPIRAIAAATGKGVATIHAYSKRAQG